MIDRCYFWNKSSIVTVLSKREAYSFLFRPYVVIDEWGVSVASKCTTPFFSTTGLDGCNMG